MAQSTATVMKTRRLRLRAAAFVLCTSGFLFSPVAPARAAGATAGPVTFVGQVIEAAGSPNGSAVIATVPNGFRFVVQTVSFFRSNVTTGSIGQVFLQVTLNKTIGYIALPEAVADGSIYPAATLTASVTCGAGTQIIANAYRSGSDTAQETVNLIVTGTYVAYSGT